MEWIVIFGYGVSLLLICLFSLGQLNLSWHYLNRKKDKPKLKQPEKWPVVTVQLPVYNEKYVVGRLIKAVSAFDYPADKLEIQVLDDSSDETVEIARKLVSQLRSEGLNIQHIRRKDRSGFKAGALAHGLQVAKGEYIAIFDADFLPKPTFLKDTLPYFSMENVGMVQTRWTHVNENYSLITKLQAFGLDAHFTVEQNGRKRAGSLINFNGTAGIWRKTCIEDAGGWQHDTLTEDLDLSYRAQLKGWEFCYQEEIESPAELPVTVSAVKSQQHRWNKGAVETARKNLGLVFRSGIKPVHKLRAFMHLLNSSVFLFLLLAGVLSVPMMFIRQHNQFAAWLFSWGMVFVSGFVAIAVFYWVATKAIKNDQALKTYIWRFPLFLTFSMGLAVQNSVAVLEGLFGFKSTFVRTPKFNVFGKKDSWKGNIYAHRNLSVLSWVELALALYFAFGIALGFAQHDFGLLLFHAMLMTGFGGVFFLSVKRDPHGA